MNQKDTHKKEIVSSSEMNVILNRLACQLIERHGDFSNTALIGIQPRGTFLAKRLVTLLSEKYNIKNVPLGLLDITFFRDDFRRNNKPLEANSTDINFIVEDKKVVFVDDVLYTGRSIRSALTAIQSFGRPSEIELLVFIDRRFSRHLPIQPNYKGRQVDAINQERVIVHWKEKDGEDTIYIINKDKI
ncbi:bifunctional pyr operon transcriptional regulator/uracil phosphoribosyltransferase PyrR [Capnocytophaga canis]|uniref:bifunctional pyr operon transcriptional regulator/uracil phosphoribosyltransferase PyrR n=1 Tax=Capnocytophaga canis TaxID=1848903 RepID=UPI001561FE44|nr:bifunctional pyr operon transcriptional regulator/uracil phosphoribosyltransferase PyrR [Capnocytophaga canis]